MPNTREKLIDAIEKEKPYIPTSDYEVGYNNGLVMAQSIILATDNNVGSKWIPVTERLPDKGGSYLVFSSKSKTVFTAHYWLGDRWANRANGQFITHWMPLPEAPKGE